MLKDILDSLGGQIKRGDFGPEVMSLQRALNAAHASAVPLKDDGKFGLVTEAAVREFQARHGLPTDGIFDTHTLRALERALESPITPPITPPKLVGYKFADDPTQRPFGGSAAGSVSVKSQKGSEAAVGRRKFEWATQTLESGGKVIYGPHDRLWEELRKATEPGGYDAEDAEFTVSLDYTITPVGGAGPFVSIFVRSITSTVGEGVRPNVKRDLVTIDTRTGEVMTLGDFISSAEKCVLASLIVLAMADPLGNLPWGEFGLDDPNESSSDTKNLDTIVGLIGGFAVYVEDGKPHLSVSLQAEDGPRAEFYFDMSGSATLRGMIDG